MHFSFLAPCDTLCVCVCASACCTRLRLTACTPCCRFGRVAVIVVAELLLRRLLLRQLLVTGRTCRRLCLRQTISCMLLPLQQQQQQQLTTVLRMRVPQTLAQPVPPVAKACHSPTPYPPHTHTHQDNPRQRPMQIFSLCFNCGNYVTLLVVVAIVCHNLWSCN